MTTRNDREQWVLELKARLMTRFARRALTTRTKGIDGIAKSLLDRQMGRSVESDPELDHPDDWDRPID